MWIPVSLTILVLGIWGCSFLLTPEQKKGIKMVLSLLRDLAKYAGKSFISRIVHLLLDIAGPRNNARIIKWPTREAITIIYTADGKQEAITVPYNRKRLPYTGDIELFAKIGRDTYAITQHPGTFYNFTGKDLGATLILFDGNRDRTLKPEEKINE